MLIKANDKANKYVNYKEAIRLQVLLRYRTKEMIISDLVSHKRELLYHSDLISLRTFSLNRNQTVNDFTNVPLMHGIVKKKKSDPSINPHNSSNNVLVNKTYHLVLFSDLLLITLKEL